MRSNYPLSSLELNDKLYSAYEHLTYLLSYENNSGVLISGKFDILDNVISNMFLSGVLALNDNISIPPDYNLVPLSGYMNIVDFLKMDYIYRKHFESEV